MRIALIGNGPVDCNWSDEIDAADNVVRLNACTEFGGAMVGTITHTLICRSSWNPHGQLVANCPAFSIPDEVTSQAIRFGILESRVKLDGFDYVNGWDAFTRRYPALRTCWRFEIPLSADDACRLAIGADRQPTLGAIVLHWLLSKQKESQITLYGFPYTTCLDVPGHDYEGEEVWLNRLLRSGLIRGLH